MCRLRPRPDFEDVELGVMLIWCWRNVQVTALKAKLDTWRKTLPTPFVQSGSRTPAAAPPKAPTVDRAAAFTRWDKNTDSILTLEEYTNGLAKKDDAPKRFQAFDQDRDGKLTREEFVGAK